MKNIIKLSILVLVLGVFMQAPEAQAAKKKTAKVEKSSARKPASAAVDSKLKLAVNSPV